MARLAVQAKAFSPMNLNRLKGFSPGEAKAFPPLLLLPLVGLRKIQKENPVKIELGRTPKSSNRMFSILINKEARKCSISITYLLPETA